MDEALTKKFEQDIGLLTQAICLLTTHATALVHITDSVALVMRRTTDELHALQTAVLGFVDLVEGLQRRVDRLERRANTNPTFVTGGRRAH